MGKILVNILKAPLFLLVGVATLASYYLAFTKQYSITYASPVILTLIVALYIIARYLEKKEVKDDSGIS